jgi:type VI secretion system secreted protein VgrG
MPRTQANRILALSTPLGDDVLLLTGLRGTEQLGRPFQYELDLLSENASVNFDQVVGHNVTARYELPGQTMRYFNGFVSRFVQTSANGRTASYQATIVPWLWFLTRTADCRIFQNKSVPDIVKEVCAAHGFSDVDESLSGTHDAWEYCVQYRETDFNFVSRLMEQEGIYYYFKHADGQHTMVLCDSPAAHHPADGFESVAFRAPSNDITSGYVTDWSLARQVEPGTYTLNDYDFTKPKASLLAKSQVPRGDAYNVAEVYDYPGEYTVVADGEEYAKIRIQELQAAYEVASAATDSPGLATGFTFALTDFPRDDQNRQYLITSATCQIVSDEYDSTTVAAGNGSNRRGGGDEGPTFTGHFTAVDAQVPYRPARVTPKPTVAGPQTAVVVGPSGQEIYTDQYARVKVQFMWDRLGQADDKSSCWIRVAQVWAGKGWGGILNPRVGQEVIVDFLEGDPDQPIITGRVYNGVEKPPYPLPDRQTISAIKSNSSPGGGGFNEIRFEDKKGSEQIFIHGEKNQDTRIKNDCFEWIGHDRHLVVKNSQFEHVDLDRDETIDQDHKEKVGRDRHTTIAGKEAKEVTGTLSLKVGGDVAEVFKGNHSEQVTSDYYLKADNIVIEAMTSITIKVGQQYIAIDSTGLKIGSNGTFDTESMGATTIKSTAPLSIQSQATGEVKAMGPLTLQSQAQAQVKAPLATVQADGVLTLKGGITMIN